ncbi:hypothetical protein MNBD_GAMMA17-2046 [hydrothermal vent metagenome]|uniref:Autotransporter domain-containing protein n=1 Tax=hydrothermal vent metagenome TaxID=652676 RepID=A0A3B0ZED9_9ZZZZ
MNTIKKISKNRAIIVKFLLVLFPILSSVFTANSHASGHLSLFLNNVQQSPANNLPPGQQVTYSLPLSTNYQATTPPGASLFFEIIITGASNNNISAAFTSSSNCTIDGNTFFCRGININQPQEVLFSWIPPIGSTAITFRASCGELCTSPPPATVITIVREQEIIPELTQTTFNDTQRATAESLNQLCFSATHEAVINQCENLSALSESALGIALSQIAPDEVTAQGTNSVKVTTTQLSNVQTRLASLRNGPSKTQFSMKGIMLAMNGDSLPAGLLADSSDFGSDLSSLIKDSRLGLFVSGRINFGEKDSTSRESGFDFETLGITAGLDYWYNSKLVLGGALGYAKTDSDFNANGGNLDSTAHSASFYGSYYLREDAYVDWIATYGSNDFSTRRTIIYSGVNTATQGDTSGSQLGLSSTATIDYRIGKLLISPYMRVDYINANIKGYRETGGSGLALAIEKQNTKSFATALAVRASQAISQRWGVLVPSAYVEWEHEFKDDGRLIIARFVEDPTSAFSIATDNPDRDYFKFGAALSATFPRGKSAYISVATVAGQDTITSSTIDLGGRMEF